MSHSVRISSFFGDELILGSFIAKTIPVLIALIIILILTKKFNIFCDSNYIFISNTFKCRKISFCTILNFFVFFFIGLQVKFKNKIVPINNIN